MKRYFFLLILFFGLAVNGQIVERRAMDSLLQELPHCKQDTICVNLLYEISKQYYFVSQYDSALHYINIAKQLAKKLHFKRGRVKAYNIIGVVYFDLGDYPDALNNYLAALKIVEILGDRDEIAKSYNDIGNVYRSQNNYVQSLKSHYTALKIRKELGNKSGIAMSLINIANVYKKQGDYTKALENYFIAVKICEEIGDKKGLAISNNNIGNTYLEQGNYEEGLKTHFIVLKMQVELGDKTGQALSYFNIGNAYNKLNQPEEAAQWLDKSLNLAKEIGARDVIRNAYNGFAVADSILGNYKSAYENYKLFIIYRDSLFNIANIQKITEANMRYEFEKKEAVAKIKHEKMIDHERLRFEVVLTLVLFIALLGFLLYYITRLKKKKEKQIFITMRQVIELEKQKVEAELNQAHHDIQRFVKKIDDKNICIETVSQELENIKNSNKIEFKDLGVAIISLRNTHILTSDDWVAFLSGFNKIYPLFALRVREKYPKITPSELRYLMLTKIGLVHKEMANTLGVSTDTVRVTWNRVRNKLNGSLDDDPHTLLNRLEVELLILN